MNAQHRLAIEHHTVTTPDGWTLELRRGRGANGPVNGMPVLFVHGYGMNAHLFHAHPTGPSFFDVLMEHGLDPWAVDLRGTKTSEAPHAWSAVRLADIAFKDVPASIDHVRAVTGRDRIHAIGVSLGGGALYAHVGRDAHHIDRLVTMGSPLVWQDRGAVLWTFGALGPALSRIPLRGTTQAARAVLPLARRLGPKAVGFYVNPEITDTLHPETLLRTIEDPHPDVSASLSRWIRQRHLVLAGHHVTHGLKAFGRPTLAVYAEGDGVCPPAAARAVLDYTGGPVDTLAIDDGPNRVSHVDLFAAHFAPERVFPPVARWLAGPEPTLQPAATRPRGSR